jgi:hypothetical protein
MLRDNGIREVIITRSFMAEKYNFKNRLRLQLLTQEWQQLEYGVGVYSTRVGLG